MHSKDLLNNDDTSVVAGQGSCVIADNQNKAYVMITCHKPDDADVLSRRFSKSERMMRLLAEDLKGTDFDDYDDRQTEIYELLEWCGYDI